MTRGKPGRLQSFCRLAADLGRACAAVPFASLVPGTAMACALPPSIILTLPTGHYILAAGLTVAGTALLAGRAASLPAFGSVALGAVGARPRMDIGSWIGFLLLAALILVGFLGDRDPMHNLMTLVFWVGIWVALPLASMIFGNLWQRVSPWRGPVRLLRRILHREGGIGLAALGVWPAVIGLAAFSWFQIVSLHPDDPEVLARLALCYWLLVFGLAVAEGEDWLERGEFLTVIFTMLSRVAPLWREDCGDGMSRWRLGLPGAQIARLAPLSMAEFALVTLFLAALSFDGLSETFFWHGLIGENPLEPTGRSGVMLANTLGLVAGWALTLGLVLGAIRLGGVPAGPAALGFLAIAAGYHAAHYLVMLLSAGQYLLEALNDPLHSGASLLGLPHHFVSMGFLSDPATMPLIYGAQFLAIVLAHLLAVVLTLKSVGPAAGFRAHFPLTALMVGYTVFGLWLLSTARAG